MAERTGRISIGEKVGYSLGDTASNLFFQTFMLFLTYFYTDVFGISAAAVATMFLVTRIWDAVNDPMMGMIADRTNTRMGKFRPFMLWFSLPFGVICFLMFVTPDFSYTGKVIYAFITYTLAMMMYTAFNVPYSALMGVITPNSQERTVVSSYRFVAAFIGGIIVQSTLMVLARKLGGGNEPLGWQWAMAIMAGLAVFLILIAFATTKERVHPPAGQKSTFKQDFSDLGKNVPWLLVGIASVLHLTNVVMRNGCIMYYFKYYTGDIHFSVFGKSFDLVFDNAATTFMLVGTATTIVFAILANRLSKKFDKRNAFLGSLVITNVSVALFYFIPPQNYLLMLLFQVLTASGMGVIAVLQWAMFTDTADYSEWKNGRRATGLVMSASLFAIKLGLALGGAILAGLLAVYGFVPNVDQTPLALQGIHLTMSFYTAIFGFAAIALMWFYPLSNQKMIDIENDLLARREDEAK